MKNIKTLVGAFSFALLFNCGDQQNSKAPVNMDTPSSSTTAQPYQDGDNVVDNTAVGQVRKTDSLDDTGNKVDSIDNNNRTNKMFSDLNFTDDQMEAYRTASRQYRARANQQNANRTMSKQDLGQQEDQIMKSFLNSSRYEQYKEWARRNPYQ